MGSRVQGFGHAVCADWPVTSGLRNADLRVSAIRTLTSRGVMIYIIHSRDRAKYEGKMPCVYVGRGSPLGNPYRIGAAGTRPEVINLYRQWLEQAMQYNVDVTDALLEIEKLSDKGNVALVCWCAPKECHASVIRDIVHQGGFAPKFGESLKVVAKF